MSLPESRQLIARVTEDFENIPGYGIGSKGTQMWLREYEKYANLTGSYLENNHQSWTAGVYRWSQLFAFYKLWYEMSISMYVSLWGYL